jgi:hypothetical protein
VQEGVVRTTYTCVSVHICTRDGAGGLVPAPAGGRDVMRGAVQAGAVPAGTRVAVLVNGATRSSAEILAGECVRDASLRRILTVYAVCILYTDGWRSWSTARRGRRRRYWQASVCVMPACGVY